MLTADILSKPYNVYFCVFDLTHKRYCTDLKMLDLGVPSQSNLFMKIKNVIIRAYKLRKTKKTLDIHISISFGMTANLVNVFSKRKDKTVVSVRGYSSVTNSFMAASLFKRIYKKADVITSVSKVLTTALIQDYAVETEKIATIYNPYDFDYIQQQALKDIPIHISKPTIVSMGRLQKVKGFRHLISSIKIVIERIPNIQLLLIGEGKEEKSLMEHAEQLGIPDHVRFLGFQKNPFSFISRCSIYVSSSIYEGFPNALVESMICGLPIIATDCKSGPREILSSEHEDKSSQNIEFSTYGVLVPSFKSYHREEPEKERFLADAIIKLLTDVELYNHYSARARIRAKDFSKAVYRNKITNIIES